MKKPTKGALQSAAWFLIKCPGSDSEGVSIRRVAKWLLFLGMLGQPRDVYKDALKTLTKMGREAARK